MSNVAAVVLSWLLLLGSVCAQEKIKLPISASSKTLGDLSYVQEGLKELGRR